MTGPLVNIYNAPWNSCYVHRNFESLNPLQPLLFHLILEAVSGALNTNHWTRHRPLVRSFLEAANSALDNFGHAGNPVQYCDYLNSRTFGEYMHTRRTSCEIFRFQGEEGERRHIVEFTKTDGYEERSFDLEPVTVMQRVTFMFLPGSCCDF